MIEIATLGSYRDRGYRLVVCCQTRGCQHYSEPDINILIAEFGADFDAIDRQQELLSRLRCSRCKGKNVATILLGPNGYRTHPDQP